jgi:hypothetical protein
MQFITESFLPDLPASVVIEMLISITLWLYCLFFFYFHHAPGEMGDDEFDLEESA